MTIIQTVEADVTKVESILAKAEQLLPVLQDLETKLAPLAGLPLVGKYVLVGEEVLQVAIPFLSEAAQLMAALKATAAAAPVTPVTPTTPVA